MIRNIVGEHLEGVEKGSSMLIFTEKVDLAIKLLNNKLRNT